MKIEKTAATLTIKDAAKMSVKGKRSIAQWLREHADSLEKHGHEYNARFRGRYFYTEK